jgi:hypothetical protein
MSVNGLTLDKLSDTQRETMAALHTMGGTGMRRDIANAAGITNIRSVTVALTRLEAYGFVDQRNDRLWKCTSEGLGLFGEAPVSEPQSLETPENAEPETLSEPSEPEALNAQVVMHAEIKRWRQRMNPRFSTNDAAWLCQVLASELNDMPSISSLLEQMADYWRSVHEPTKHP